MSRPPDFSAQYCEDGVFVPASAEHVYRILRDIGSWNAWWATMSFTPQADRPLEPGDRVLFDGGVICWTAEVISTEAPRSIRFRYASGALVGETEWRVTPEPGGCQAAYIYHGVEARAERAALTFGRFGTRLHTMVMECDALDGLLRKATGQPLDEAWRQRVREAVARGRERLIAGEGA